MNIKRFIRKTHYWLSLAIALPGIIMIAAGIILMLKKQIPWVQPSSTAGSETHANPQLSFAQLLDVARKQELADIQSWEDISRIDMRPNKGMAKIIAKSGWEIQVDLESGDVLKTAFRRSDVIEAIHDGSYFADWVKLGVFLPAGTILLIMWATGIYLFIIPRLGKKKRKKAPVKSAKSDEKLSEPRAL